ncbi:MAG: tetratricopeptide repeat protein [Ardenticatenaceae bacterium]|nr:tetratricopeptide repeat protein [Ardenticatenaceae bacterium]
MARKKDPRLAAQKNQEGAAHFKNWEMDQAIAAFQQAVRADSDNPDYHLNLARAHARSGDYHQAMSALGDYIRTETDEKVVERFERMFSSALDEVETTLIETMRKNKMPVQQIGKAIQMWLEYRITLGRTQLRVMKPELWAGALMYAVGKVNFADLKLPQVAVMYNVNERSLKEKYTELVAALDIMPADYRYFVGERNPLDKLVEAAKVLEELDRRFQED